jgi:hypothetical protein
MRRSNKVIDAHFEVVYDPKLERQESWADFWIFLWRIISIPILACALGGMAWVIRHIVDATWSAAGLAG